MALVSHEKSSLNGGRAWRKTLKSALAAAFGVQSTSTLQEDFESRSPLKFIVAGIVLTVLFVGSLVFVANLITS